MKLRAVAKMVRGREFRSSSGLRLTRVLGHLTADEFDPFLLLDVFDSGNVGDCASGFMRRPFQGLETITYLLEGKLEDAREEQSSGRAATFRRDERLLGFQLRISLPAGKPAGPPLYRELTADSVPKIYEPGVLVRVISGSYRGDYGTTREDLEQADYLDLEMREGVGLLLRTPKENTVFVYIIRGELATRESGAFLPEREAVLLSPGEGVRFFSGAQGARFMFMSARPLRERAACKGPMIMNTEEELCQAFQELDEGVFINPVPANMM